jgi:hypothetical protein
MGEIRLFQICYEGELTADVSYAMRRLGAEPNFDQSWYVWLAENKEAQYLSTRRRESERQLQKLVKELEEQHSARPRERYTAFIEIEVFEAGDLTVELTYVITGAGWQPLYDLRLVEEDSKPAALDLGYLAQISQNTGEAWAFGTIGALVTGTTLMGQIERALNRLYGIEQDRDTLHKYTRALVLALVAGALAVLAFLGLGLGGAIASSLGGGPARTIWNVGRWPLGIALLMAATALIFRWAPRRQSSRMAPRRAASSTSSRPRVAASSARFGLTRPGPAGSASRSDGPCASRTESTPAWAAHRVQRA